MTTMAEGLALSTAQQRVLGRLLGDQRWRLEHLYWITDKDGRMRRFSMNWAQRELHEGAHTRNNILKVRQLGISTYMAVLILDSSLFNRNHSSAIVDRTLPDAEEKMAKIRFAWENLEYLPENPSELDRELAQIGGMIKAFHAPPKDDGTPGACPIGAKKAKFSNGSIIRIGTTLRGGTLQLLHVSELGSISKNDPQRAQEIISGTLESVGKDCRVYFESTHEGGKTGVNYEQVMTAMGNIGKELTPLDFKFFFFPWYKHPDYCLPGAKALPTQELASYFRKVEGELGIKLSEAQMAWYVAKERSLRSFMRQEYPTTPDEALNPIMEGTIFAGRLMELMERGHLMARYEHMAHRPVYTTWDLGINDFMSIWWLQPDGHGKWLVLDNYTANRLPIEHYIDVLREKDVQYGRCAGVVLPHDGTRHDMHLDTWDMAFRRAGYRTIGVPRTQNKWQSIENTRELLRSCIFHERCSEPTNVDGTKYPSGVDALKDYRTRPPGANGVESREPLHDVSSHASDALRTFADALVRGLVAAENGWESGQRVKRRSQSNYVSNMLN